MYNLQLFTDEQMNKIRNRHRYVRKQKAVTDNLIGDLELLGYDGEEFSGSQADIGVGTETLFSSSPHPQPRTFLIMYLFWVLHHFQHGTSHITMGSWKDRGNQYIQVVKVLYCKLPTNSKQLPGLWVSRHQCWRQ